MDEAFKFVFEDRSNLIIVAGLLFLAIAVVGKISGKIDPGPNGRIASGVVGAILLVAGLTWQSAGEPGPSPVADPLPDASQKTAQPTPPKSQAAPNSPEPATRPDETPRSAANTPDNSAGQGDVRADVARALLQAKDDYNARNYRTAFPAFLKLAESGDAEAMYYLGRMYLNGQGVTASPQSALRWLERSARAGNADAMFTLGVVYARGQGVERNTAQAARWFEAADRAGHPGAKRALDSVRNSR